MARPACCAGWHTSSLEVATVFVDLYEVTSMSDVVVRFDDALVTATSAPDPMSGLAQRFAVEVSLNLGAVKVALTGPARNRPEPSLLLHSLLDVIVRTATATPSLLVVDEFSSVARVDGAAGAMRTAFQHHYRDLGLVFAGSQPSMMRTLFTDRPQPFYGQVDLVEIGALDAAAVEELVEHVFASTGRRAGRLAGHILTFAERVPIRGVRGGARFAGDRQYADSYHDPSNAHHERGWN